MSLLKPSDQAIRTKRITPRDETTTFSGISRKPIILQDVGTREDAETYRALRKLFQLNKTYTSTLLNELDLDALQDLLEKQVFDRETTVCTRVRKGSFGKKVRSDRTFRRSTKMWKPLV